ncbi:MAG TPA: cupin domain-containing protein [Gaiellaceae bacterium]|nr:cupin domain-containing protein [Gaiellaceae bacterium]
MATRATPTRTTPTRTPPSPAALARAVEPFEVERFLAEHWERQPLVVPRGEEGRFDDLLSTRDVERLITETGIRLPAFRLVKAGETVAGYTADLSWRPSPFTGVADVHRVLEEFERGATIVLQGLHHLWLPLARYCRHLEAFLGHPAQANAYYTPAGSQGLPVHHDTHEVISLQVAGSKRWLVYEPVLELPLKNQRYRSALGEPGASILDVVLQAGDTLYLPRGWLHQALTSDDDSLHITVGVNVRRWIDEARAELDAAEAELAFRQTIDAEEPPELPSLDPDAVRARARARFVQSRRPVLDGQLSELRALPTLSADELERRDTVIADLDGTTLTFEGKMLRFPARLEPELEFLVTTESPFRASELPGGLDDAGRLVLVRRLVREGFLRHAVQRYTASAG